MISGAMDCINSQYLSTMDSRPQFLSQDGMASTAITRQLPLMKDLAFPLADGLSMRLFHTEEGVQLTLFRVNIKGHKYNVCTFTNETWQYILGKQDVINSCIELVTPTT